MKKRKPKITPERSKVFTRRALLLGGGQIGLLSLLVGRLYHLQILESSKYVVLAEENRVNLRLLAPPRGRIYDRYGVEVASNRQNYRIVLVPEQARDVRRILGQLASIVDLNEEDRWRVLKEAARKRRFVPIIVRDNLTWKEVSRIEVNSPDLPG